MLADDMRAARKRKGLTQRQLADAAGLSVDSIKGFEGGGMPGPDSLARLRSVLDLTGDDPSGADVLLTLILPNGMQLQIRAAARPVTKP